MGCSSSDIKTENENIALSPEKEILETKEENDNMNIIKQQVIQKQNDIIQKYQKKKGNTNKVSLSNISSCFIKFWNTQNGPKYSVKSKDENILKFLEDMNPFNENIKQNKDLNQLQNELYETELYYSKETKPNSDNNLKVKSTQKIHSKYNLSLRLKNTGTNQCETFNFNELDKPLLIIFFKFTEEKALNKIQEIKSKEIELENQEDKNFLFLPIINIFVDQYESISLKKYKHIFDILKTVNKDDLNYYVLLKNVNEHFTNLFELKKMKQSKCIFINRSSEISIILDDKVEYLNYEMIDFFLNVRNNEYSNDYFSLERKRDIINILEKNKLNKKYKFEIDLKIISSEKKMPAFLRFTYNEREKDSALQLYNNTINELKTKIKKVFCSEYMIKDNIKELFNLIKLLNQKINEEIIQFKNIEGKSNEIPFILNCKSNIINDNNEKSNNSNNNEICKIKKFSVNYYINEELYFPQIINLFKLYLKENPKYLSLNSNFQIFPIINTKIKTTISKCKEIKLTGEILKSKKIKLINEPESEINLEKNNIEVFLLIENNILKIEEQRKKINVILQALYSNEIKFILFFFGENEFDIQNLNLLSKTNLFFNDKKELGKIIFLNKLSNESFYPFCFYSLEPFFKMFKLDKDYKLMNIYNLDLFDSNNFTESSIKNRNIFNFLVYISKKDNLDLNANNIPVNNEKDYKAFKENKKKIYEILSNTDEIIKANNNKLLMNFYINFTYNKLYVLSKEDFENSKINNKKYNNAIISLTYLDYKKEKIFDKIKEIISKNNNNNKSTINIKIKEYIISTFNPIPNPQTIFECPKCERSYTLEQNSFYFCTQCKEKSFFCDECFSGFNATIKDKNKLKEKDKEKQNFHEHHLILFYKYSQNKTSFIIKEKYDKYMNLLKDKKAKKNLKIKCDICDKEQSFNKSKIIISHFKKKKIDDNNLIDLNMDNIEEITICNKCFKSNLTSNILEEEFTDNNIIIF